MTLIRRIDRNWYEGRIGGRKGIFPSSYVEILCEPGETRGKKCLHLCCFIFVFSLFTFLLLLLLGISPKPVATPAAHGMVKNGFLPSMSPYVPPELANYVCPLIGSAFSCLNFPTTQQGRTQQASTHRAKATPASNVQQHQHLDSRNEPVA